MRGAYPGAVFGFAQGFDRFQDNQTRALRFNVESLLEWLDEQEGGPFFAYLHIIEVHSPYVPPRIAPWERDQWLPEDLARATPIVAEEALRYLSFDPAPGYRGSVKGTLGNLKELEQSKGRIPEASRLRLLQIYDRGIAYTDYWMGQLFEALKQRDLWEQTIVVVTADHGEEFLEHGGLEHGRTQYDEVLRIPLIMHVPGVKGGWKIEQQVGLIDVLPTLLDLVGLEPAALVQGRSLRPLWRGEALPPASYYGEANHGAALTSLRKQRWKLIAGRGKAQLFDLVADRGEQRDVCRREQETCRELAAELRAWRNESKALRSELSPAEAPQATPDDATVERLKALGYID